MFNDSIPYKIIANTGCGQINYLKVILKEKNALVGSDVHHKEP